MHSNIYSCPLLCLWFVLAMLSSPPRASSCFGKLRGSFVHVLLTHCVQPARFSFPRVHTCAELVGVIATPDAVTSSPNVFCSVTGIPSSLSIFTVLVAPCVPLLGSPYTERCCFCPSCTTNISWTPKDPCTADRYYNRYPSSLDVSILPFTYYHFY